MELFSLGKRLFGLAGLIVPFYVGKCRDQDGKRVRCFGFELKPCSDFCMAEDVGYDCKNTQGHSTVVLNCPIWVRFAGFNRP